MIPTSFQTPRALRIINIGAVGLALAGVVAPLLDVVFTGSGPGGHLHVAAAPIGLVVGLPTLVCGVLWAWLLRSPRTVWKRKIRLGWVASVPLAMFNAGLTCALLLTSADFDLLKFVLSGLVGATVGVFFWAPALVLTLLCFGVPIASAQRLAKKGLAGEERGELVVGLACAAISVVGLLVAFNLDPFAAHGGVDAWITRSFALLGLLAGVASTILALARQARRRAFVTAAEAGTIPGYRIEATDEGKVLVRIVAQGKGYRVADFEEEVFELDAAGEAMRPKHVDPATVGRDDVT